MTTQFLTGIRLVGPGVWFQVAWGYGKYENGPFLWVGGLFASMDGSKCECMALSPGDYAGGGIFEKLNIKRADQGCFQIPRNRREGGSNHGR